MLKNTSIILVVLLFTMSVVLSGCGKTACKRLCECLPGSEEDCIEECEDEYDDEDDSDCRKGFRAYARCLNREDCNEYACDDEAEEWWEACN